MVLVKYFYNDGTNNKCQKITGLFPDANHFDRNILPQ